MLLLVLGEKSDSPFPDVNLASQDPDGLLAFGGDLSEVRLLNAYQSGIFPWYGWDEPILWWSPNPRFILFPDRLKISKSMRKVMRQNIFQFKLDHDFGNVIHHCAKPRKDGLGTWIVPDMIEAYNFMHKAGWAHSAEAYLDGKLVGGLYGIAIDRVFFGESMFSLKSNASKAAFIFLVNYVKELGFGLIDCQVYTEHLASLGAELVPRESFGMLLKKFCVSQSGQGHWNNTN